MNPLEAAVLLAFAVGVTWAPWRRGEVHNAGGRLLLEAGALLAALALAGLLGELVRPTAAGYRWGQVGFYVAGYWYATIGGARLVRLVLDLVPVHEQPGRGGGITVPPEELARGRIIGILERAIVLTLVLLAEFGALGFVVAAKALARFRGLDDRDFAEYFLIGTLASLLHALATGIGLRLLS